MEEVYRDEFYTLSRSLTGTGQPIFVMPPFAGRGGGIADNLFNKCRQTGSPVWRYELHSATQQTKNLNIEGLISILIQSHDIISNCCSTEQMDIAACCQGGWLATIFTAMHQERVSKLALFAAPTRFRTANPNTIENYCRSLSLSFHEWLVVMNGGVQSGLLQWLAFAMMAPEKIFFGRYIDLFSHIINNRPEKITKWGHDNGWYDDPRHLPAWYLWALEHLFVKDELCRGTLVVNGIAVNPKSITCPVYVFAGADDDITSIEQASGILDVVSSKEKRLTILDKAGHTKVFTGAKELQQFYDLFFGRQLSAYEIELMDQIRELKRRLKPQGATI